MRNGSYPAVSKKVNLYLYYPFRKETLLKYFNYEVNDQKIYSHNNYNKTSVKLKLKGCSKKQP